MAQHRICRAMCLPVLFVSIVLLSVFVINCLTHVCGVLISVSGRRLLWAPVGWWPTTCAGGTLRQRSLCALCGFRVVHALLSVVVHQQGLAARVWCDRVVALVVHERHLLNTARASLRSVPPCRQSRAANFIRSNFVFFQTKIVHLQNLSNSPRTHARVIKKLILLAIF